MNRPEGISENRQQLIDLLSTDFEPPVLNVQTGVSDIVDLRSFRSQADISELIKRRGESEENIQLGLNVDRLLDPAPITLSFKKFITESIRRAHAWQTTVDDALAPDRLGLSVDEGIFANKRAPEIEAQVWRGLAHDIFDRYAVILEQDNEKDESLLIVRWSKETRLAVLDLGIWCSDYQLHYGKTPYADMDPSAFLAAATRAAIEPDLSDVG